MSTTSDITDNNNIFISYAERVIEYANRLYEDLKKFDLKPWRYKEDILPGQKIDLEIKKWIEQSRYFISLLSKQSVETRGEIHKQIRQAIDVLEEYPENDIYFIPARLDDCQIPFEELRKYQWVDLFPQSEWFNGINKILKAVGSSKRFEKIDGTIKRNILFKFINEKVSL